MHANWSPNIENQAAAYLSREAFPSLHELRLPSHILRRQKQHRRGYKRANLLRNVQRRAAIQGKIEIKEKSLKFLGPISG